MSYFRNVKFVPYQFGNEETLTLHQDLGAYVDLIDQVRDNAAFYKKYTILDGDRPDNLSYKFYRSPKYYWTFFLINDALREQGWPLTNQDVLATVQRERSGTTLITRADLTGIFKLGSTVTGVSSGRTGTIVDRKLEFGQIIVEGEVDFSPTEQVRVIEDGTTYTIQLVGVAPEWESVHHYEDSDGNWVDVNPYQDPPALFAAVSHYDRYVRENDALKDIIIIKPNAIDAIFQQFQEAMSNK